MKNAIKVKVLKKFINPLTNRMAEVDQVLNVPEGIFWLRRLDAKDCERVLEKPKSKDKPASQKAEKKGSK